MRQNGSHIFRLLITFAEESLEFFQVRRFSFKFSHGFIHHGQGILWAGRVSINKDTYSASKQLEESDFQVAVKKVK